MSSFQKSQWNGKDQFAETPTEVMIELVKEFGYDTFRDRLS